MKKVCSKCKTEKDCELFHKGNAKHGTYSWCKECVNKRSRKYYIKNQEKQIRKSKIWRKKNKKKHSKYNTEYYNKNKEKIKARHKIQGREYREKNKEKINKTRKKQRKSKKYKTVRRIWEKNRKQSNPLYKLKCNIHALILVGFKGHNHKKESKTTEILCCQISEFKTHIERQFENWMNWKNYGKYVSNGIRTWQLDHIIPTASAKNVKELIVLNHYSNFRPFDSYENLMKSDTIQ